VNDIKTPEENVPPPLPGPENRIRPVSNDMPVKQADEMFCSNCGAIIKIRSLSCPRCGKKQRKDGMGCFPIAAIVLGIGIFGIAVLGILAAIAIPQFSAYRARAYQVAVTAELNEICKAQEAYFTQNDKYTDSLEELGYITKPNISIRINELDDECFYAQGEMKNLNKRYLIDCDCTITEEAIESTTK
jgi:type IV pilus assembly protein PilA